MSEILKILKEHKLELFNNYPIESLALFGSYSRGDNKKSSDVDIMVELKTADFETFCNLSYHLKKILKKKVDLVSRNGVKEKYYRYLEKDLKYV
ncbi:MAG TPA: nucleotidyltransferase domain-containing protein [Chitinophagaceae bacterium]|jgi:predicted nucleotidyltransferase